MLVCQRYSSTVNGKAQSKARLHLRPHSIRGTADQHNLRPDIHALLLSFPGILRSKSRI